MIKELRKDEIYSPNIDGYFISEQELLEIGKELAAHYKTGCDKKYSDECIEMIAEKLYGCNRHHAIGRLEALKNN